MTHQGEEQMWSDRIQSLSGQVMLDLIIQTPTTSAVPLFYIGTHSIFLATDAIITKSLTGHAYDGGKGFAKDNCCFCTSTRVSVIVLVFPCCMLYFVNFLLHPWDPYHPYHPFSDQSINNYPSFTDLACGNGNTCIGECTGAKQCCTIKRYGDDYCGSNKNLLPSNSSPTLTASPTWE